MTITVHDHEIQRVLRAIQDEVNTGHRQDGLLLLSKWYNDATLLLTDAQRELVERALKEHNSP